MLYLEAISGNSYVFLLIIILKGEHILYYYIRYTDFLNNYILGI